MDVRFPEQEQGTREKARQTDEILLLETPFDR